MLICGAAAMKYYLPTLLEKLGLSTRVALMAGGIESTLKIGMTIIEMLLIDRLGRRVTLVSGTLAMGFALLINGVLGQVYPSNTNRAADIVCVVFIFVYALGYSMGFGPAAWVYGSEIFPTAVRARGLNFSASGTSIGSIVAAQVWPVGIETIGSKIYFFFMAINFACIPREREGERKQGKTVKDTLRHEPPMLTHVTQSQIILLFYPETKGVSLEDMGTLFNSSQRHLPTHDDGEGRSERISAAAAAAVPKPRGEDSNTAE
ncbi:hypothetical protein RRF57_001649 [Xylaria bambusicola]|uniref:Major facilitator superfamily (MFS) profile domain-containing protein n=1 Tax=Xylaria bambusicola TaxID=326684 RepID=A0AAN7UCB4_9PEZI